MNYLAVLDKLLYFIQKWFKRREELTWQKEQDELEASPAEWFDTHFDGMSAMPADDKTIQTNSTDK